MALSANRPLHDIPANVGEPEKLSVLSHLIWMEVLHRPALGVITPQALKRRHDQLPLLVVAFLFLLGLISQILAV